MKQIPIDECPAGPEIDAAVEVARNRPGQFFDYVCINGKSCDIRTWIPEGFTPEQPPVGSRAGKMPRRYSAFIAAAWELVEELYQQTEEWISIARDAKGNYWVGVIGAVSDYDWWEYSSKADTAPLAITRAYLKTKGVEFVEVEE